MIKEEYEEIEITKDGEELLAKLWPVHEKTENMVLEGFSEQEKRDLKSYLDKIQQNCKKIMEYKV